MEDLDRKENSSVVKEWQFRKRSALWLIGKPNQGKTYAAKFNIGLSGHNLVHESYGKSADIYFENY